MKRDGTSVTAVGSSARTNDPKQQGLKPHVLRPKLPATIARTNDPKQQGLKQEGTLHHVHLDFARTNDPKQQGLKPQEEVANGGTVKIARTNDPKQQGLKHCRPGRIDATDFGPNQ